MVAPSKSSTKQANTAGQTKAKATQKKVWELLLIVSDL